MLKDMPLYDYACEQCGYRFEVRQSFADDPLTVCPECTGHVRRVIHPSGIIFKGSGWYITDSRKPESSGASMSSSESASTSSATKTESKAAADD
ncbi:MAG TPA: FmdB family zinc ribbon protein [Woeseiaceae bacterium]|nr:FmdB family zinc ribbon protein [Woeseiaceae bacterium]